MLTIKSIKKMSFTTSVIVTVACSLLVAYLLYPDSAESAKGRKPIVFWVPGAANDEMKIVIDEFERRNPEFQVQIGTATVRDTVGDPTRFLLGVAGNVPPDLIYFDRFAIVEWASRGAFYPLNEDLEKEKNNSKGIHRQNYVAPAWNETVYKGNVYAIPDSVDTRALYYNKDALIRAGLVYKKDDDAVKAGRVKAGDAKPPVTWEELCDKRLQTEAAVFDDGKITVESIDLNALGVKENDVVTIQPKENRSLIFRARVKAILDSKTLQLDLSRELPPKTSSVPSSYTGESVIKIFSGDSYLVKLTHFDHRTGNLKTVGFIPFFGNSWLYMFGWLNGGEFMSEDGSKCTLNDPRIVQALEFVTDMYDCLGGVEEARIFKSSTEGSSMLDLFLNNKIAMKIDETLFMSTISAYKPNMNFGVSPAPIPYKKLKEGFKSIGWMGGWGYAIPSTAKNKDGAWKLTQWLSSLEANKTRAEFANSLCRSKGQVYFPTLSPDERFTAYLFNQYIRKSPHISQNLKDAYATFASLLPDSRYRPVTPVGQKLWSEQCRASDLAVGHTMTPSEALDNATRQVQIVLDRNLAPPKGSIIPWRTLIVVYCLAIVAFVVILIIKNHFKKSADLGRMNKWYDGYICSLPWMIGFFTFGAGPIVFSLIISFSHYDVLSPARFVGLENYANLLHDPIFWLSIKNTCFMIISVPLGIVVGIALALFLNHSLKGIQLYRTLFYLPAIVPMVAALLLWIKIFDPKIGFINQMLTYIGVCNPPAWLNSPAWAKPAIIIMGLWSVGGTMIIWLAGLKNISESLYEAAAIDGAGRWSRFVHITIPMLTPYIFFNLIMGMIGIFQIFEQAYIMTKGGPEDATLFYAYKLFNEAFRYLNFGVASAMAWFLFIVVLTIAAM